jgi:hypothetical protein
LSPRPFIGGILSSKRERKVTGNKNAAYAVDDLKKNTKKVNYIKISAIETNYF